MVKALVCLLLHKASIFDEHSDIQQGSLRTPDDCLIFFFVWFIKERLSPCSVESEPDIANHNMRPSGKQVHTEAIVMDEMMERQASSRKWLDRYSLPLDIDRSLCADNYGNQDIVSFENMKTLVPFTSKGNNLRVQGPDDETVDLTEPRFESFCIVNVKSSS